MRGGDGDLQHPRFFLVTGRLELQLLHDDEDDEVEDDSNVRLNLYVMYFRVYRGFLKVLFI